mmetsp:Transcript_29685/g.45895  ORF Transcript_29685/g.45895 Transcript_29685/m.45895 type:complete len:133 (+) Transcript_29685:94-492(+)
MISPSTFGLALVALTFIFLQNTHAQETITPLTTIVRTNRTSSNKPENGTLSSISIKPRPQSPSEKNQETKKKTNKEPKNKEPKKPEEPKKQKHKDIFTVNREQKIISYNSMDNPNPNHNRKKKIISYNSMDR